MEVELPDGRIAEFPSEMSRDEIRSILRQQFPPALPQNGGLPGAAPQYPEVPQLPQVPAPQATGFGGISRDIGRSLGAFPGAISEAVMGLPGRVKAGAQYFGEHPWKAIGQAALGVPEALTGLASAPGIAARYLGEKFAPESPVTEYYKQRLTPHEIFRMGETALGVTPTEPGAEALRGLGQLVAGGGLAGIPSRLARVGTVAATVAGEEGDPIHGALGAYLGEKMLSAAKKTPTIIDEFNTYKNIPEKIANAESEVAGLRANMRDTAALNESQLAQANQLQSETLGRGQDFAERGAPLVVENVKAKMNEIKPLYDKVDSYARESQVSIPNEKRMASISEAMDGLMEKGVLEPENDMVYSRIAEQLNEKWPGEQFETIPASDFIDIYKSTRDMHRVARQRSRESGIMQDERLRWKNKAKELEPLVDSQKQLLKETLPEDIFNTLLDADKLWKENIIPFYGNKVYQKAVNEGFVPDNMINVTRGTSKSNRAMQELIRENPELNRVALGQLFANKPMDLLKYNERVQPYIESYEPVQRGMEVQKSAQEKLNQSRKAQDAYQDLQSKFENKPQFKEKLNQLIEEFGKNEENIQMIEKLEKTKENLEKLKEYKKRKEKIKSNVMKVVGTAGAVVFGKDIMENIFKTLFR